MSSFLKVLLGLLLSVLLIFSGLLRWDSAGASEINHDTLTVDGQNLRGHIRHLDSEGVTFETIYGEGSIKVAYGKIEQISSAHSFRIYYGEEGIVQGRIMGLGEGLLIIGTDGKVRVSVETASIDTGISLQDYEASWLIRKRTDLRHWKARMKFGLLYERTAIDKNKLELGFNITRRKKPTRFVFDIDYAYEIQRASEGREVTSKDEMSTVLLGEYSLPASWYLFIRPAVEWDRPRLIDLRTYPAVGAGYRLLEEKNYLLSLPFGLGHVHEEYIGYGDNDYLSAYVGFEGAYTFDSGVKLSSDLIYMPGLENPQEDWLFRFDFSVKVPLIDPLALIWRITHVNDNNPDPKVGDNKLKTSLALSLNF